MESISIGKRCVRCGVIKSIDEFYRNWASRDGRHCYCRPCHVKVNLEYRQANREKVRAYGRQHRRARRLTAIGFLAECYNHMETRVRGKDRTQQKSYAGLPILSRKQFYSWTLSNPNFYRLYDHWIQNGQLRRDVPSVNRINSHKGYVTGNIEWLSLSENSSRAKSNHKYIIGINNFTFKSLKREDVA